VLTLYSFGPAANSLKPLLALYEKGLEFTPRFVDPTKFEHHEDWFKKINPRGQVPALDHDGRIITESTVICEYLEDAFPDAPRLRPTDPVKIAEMRVWTKWVAALSSGLSWRLQSSCRKACAFAAYAIQSSCCAKIASAWRGLSNAKRLRLQLRKWTRPQSIA